jgi:hypothetical protein
MNPEVPPSLSHAETLYRAAILETQQKVSPSEFRKLKKPRYCEGEKSSMLLEPRKKRNASKMHCTHCVRSEPVGSTPRLRNCHRSAAHGDGFLDDVASIAVTLAMNDYTRGQTLSVKWGLVDERVQNSQ